MLGREVVVVTVEADGGEMRVSVIMLCLSALEVSCIYTCFGDELPTARQPLLYLQATSVRLKPFGVRCSDSSLGPVP